MTQQFANALTKFMDSPEDMGRAAFNSGCVPKAVFSADFDDNYRGTSPFGVGYSYSTLKEFVEDLVVYADEDNYSLPLGDPSDLSSCDMDETFGPFYSVYALAVITRMATECDESPLYLLAAEDAFDRAVMRVIKEVTEFANDCSGGCSAAQTSMEAINILHACTVMYTILDDMRAAGRQVMIQTATSDDATPGAYGIITMAHMAPSGDTAMQELMAEAIESAIKAQHEDAGAYFIFKQE